MVADVRVLVALGVRVRMGGYKRVKEGRCSAVVVGARLVLLAIQSFGTSTFADYFRRSGSEDSCIERRERADNPTNAYVQDELRKSTFEICVLAFSSSTY